MSLLAYIVLSNARALFSLLPQTEIIFCCSVWLLQWQVEYLWIGWTLFSCCGRVFFFRTVIYVRLLFHAGHPWVRFCAHPLLQWCESRMSGFDIFSSSNVVCFAESREDFLIFPRPFPCSQVTSKPQALSYKFLSYRVTHFILSFNCTKHTSLNHKLLKKKYHWPKNVMAGTLETSTAFAYTHTHTHSLTHTSGSSFKCLSLYIFPVHPHTQ